MKRIAIGPTSINTGNGHMTNYVVHTPSGRIIVFFIGTSRLYYAYSDDEGLTWQTDILDSSFGTPTNVCVWYDRWSGIDDELIHIAHTNSGDDDVRYLSINASSLSASTGVVVFAGVSTAAGSTISIARMRGGNLIVCGSIDAGAENFAYKSTTVGASASFSSINSPMEAATQDQIIILPGWAADNQDAMAIFWDASANEISRKLYDDSANSWSETSIASSMVDTATTSSGNANFSAAVDIANSRNVFVAWSEVDTVNADLRCWTVTEGAITETSTNVVLNSSGEQGLCALSIDSYSGLWSVYYLGKSDGSQTFRTSVGLYRKTSADAGATWTAEEELLPSSDGRTVFELNACPITYGRSIVGIDVYLAAVLSISMKFLVCEPAGRSVNGQIGL